MITKRLKRMNPSATVELTAKVAKLRSEGKDVIGFNVGEPDFNTPKNICDAGKKAIDAGFTKYTAAAGIIELRKEICKKFEIDNNLKYSENQISVSTGAKQALINAVLALCEEGDEVIIPTPCWVSYIEMVKLAESTPILVSTSQENDFMLDIEAIKKKITSKTKAILLNTPNNPTGAVYTINQLKELGKLAVENDFYILSDEIYEKLIYDGLKHISIASISEEIKEKTVIINGFSKAYAMTGWRLGYAAGSEKIIKAMNSLQGHTTSNANSISQKAGIEALSGDQKTVDNMVKEFDKRRIYLTKRLNKMKGISCGVPKGAFYVMPDVKDLYDKEFKGKLIKDSKGLANFLLDEANIAVVPGVAFEAPNNIRISYSNSIENIEKGMDNMEKALNLLK